MIFYSCCHQAGEDSIISPDIDGQWWQLTTTYPDISPYEYTAGDNKVCDFTIFQAGDGSWQLIACVRGNTYPGSNRLLYRWEAGSLSDSMWEEKGVFLSTGGRHKPDAWGNLLDAALYNREGLLQAPHGFRVDDTWYLFYNNSGAHCLISKNGRDWEQHLNDDGNTEFFEMGRDVMIFDDREASGKWIAYYTSGSNYPQYMAARTSRSLTGIWSDEVIVYDGYSATRHPIYRNEFAESPFVIKRGELYYLFAQLHVFVSDDPLDFSGLRKVADLESPVYEERVWSPEIIEGEGGELYIAAYRTNGIWMARLNF